MYDRESLRKHLMSSTGVDIDEIEMTPELEEYTRKFREWLIENQGKSIPRPSPKQEKFDK